MRSRRNNRPARGPGRAGRLLLLAAANVTMAVGAGRAEAPAAGREPARGGLIDTSASPHVKLRSVGLGEVRWTRGFWAERFTTCRQAAIPHLWSIMSGTEPSQFYHNFLIAAGREPGRHRGPSFNDGDLYKWLEAAAAVYAVTLDQELDRQMDEVIATLRQAQRADGYLHTPVLIRARNGDAGAVPFQDPLGFEAYNLGHLLTAACVHHRATGKNDLLAVARKAGDYLCLTFENPTPRLARCSICPSHYMGMVELYRATREPRYLALARKFLDIRDLDPDGTDDNQDRIPFRRQTQATGHAVRANNLYAGAADVYAETGDRSLWPPLLSIWENVVTTKLYVTGGCGALYDGASPDGSRQQKQIGRVHQAYGREYQLPSGTAHNETCASVANVLWNWRMLQITAEARFADVLEQTLYNAVLAGISLDGKAYFYTNTLRQLERMPVDLRWSRARQPFISSFCCPPNVVRTIAEAGSYAYCRSEHTVWVNLYGGSVLDTRLADGTRLKLTQETDYPWDGRVKITLASVPAGPFAVKLRIPGWARGASLSVNGVSQRNAPEAGTYHEVRRNWSAGDVLDLSLPMSARLVEAHPLVEEARNQVAVQRGPLVYCLESPDLPRGVAVLDVAIPGAIELKPSFDAKLLGGVTVLLGKAGAVADAPWGKQLYRELAPAAARPVDLRLVPYYAWANRGPSEMTVWMPLRR
jgi:DUF1680 family protein